MSKIIGIDLVPNKFSGAVLEGTESKIILNQKVTCNTVQLCLSKTVKSSLVTQQNVKQ